MKPNQILLRAGDSPAWIERLIAPAPTVHDLTQREQSRFLSIFLLVTAFLGAGMPIIVNIGYPWETIRIDPINIIATVSVVVLLILYTANRAGHYKLAASSAILFTTFVIFVAANPFLRKDTLGILHFLVIPVLLSAMLRSRRFTIFLIVVQQIGAITYVTLLLRLENLTFGQIFGIDSPVGFPLLISVLVITVVNQQQRFEKIRRRETAESEDRYRSIVELSPDAIVITYNETFLYMNQAARRLLGLIDHPEWGALITPVSIIHPEDVAHVRAIIHATERETIPVRQRLLRPDGVIIPVEAIGAVIHFDNVLARQTVMRNITDQLEAERRALELAVERERMHLLETFISNASHDLKTPITALTTSAYVLEQFISRIVEQLAYIQNAPTVRDVVAPSANLRQMVSLVEDRAMGLRENADRLNRLLNTMLDMMRLDQRGTYDLAPCNLDRLVGDVVNAYIEEAAARQVTLVYEPNPITRLVCLDEGEFIRVVQNLVENAIRYTPAGGRVTLRSGQRVNQAWLTVHDTGIGISDVDLPHIFERLYRADKARSVHTGGNGLGLAIVKAIVEGHKGTIRVESQLNMGSTFMVVIPIACV